jgi:hypothetical protein
MVLQPAIEGMLGFIPDALNDAMKLAPWFPSDWDSVEVRNLKAGSHNVTMKMNRYPDRTVYHFSQLPDTILDIKFNPVFPPGTILESVRVNGKPTREPEFIDLYGGWVMARFGFRLADSAEVVIRHSGGITLLPLVPEPEPGDTSEGFRLISTGYDDGVYTVLLQGRRLAKEQFQVWVYQGKVPKAEGIRLISQEGNIITYEVEFPDTEAEYASKILSFDF